MVAVYAVAVLRWIWEGTGPQNLAGAPPPNFSAYGRAQLYLGGTVQQFMGLCLQIFQARTVPVYMKQISLLICHVKPVSYQVYYNLFILSHFICFSLQLVGRLIQSRHI
jgi:hypothetical protein